MTTLFKVTDAGLVAAATAAKKGIQIVIQTFKLGSGYNYTPSGTESSLKGSVLYEDVITQYTDLADGTLLVTCTVSVQAGPFDFGEVGIFTADGLLFALTAFPQLQTKYSSLGSNVNSTYTFNCHLKLGQSVAVFNLVTQGSSASNTAIEPIKYVSRWSDVLTPSQMLNTNSKQLAVAEVDNKGDYATLIQTDDGVTQGWSIQSNFFAFPSRPAIETVDSGKTFITVSEATWKSMVVGPLENTVAQAAKFSLIVESAGNLFRAANVSLLGTSVKLAFTQAFANEPLLNAGALFRLWVNDSALLKTSAEQDLQNQINDLTVLATSLALQLEEGIPSGMIARWSKTVIPEGWVICDGANGTPDLRDKFVLGAGSAYPLGSNGGNRNAVVVAHTHNVSLTGSTDVGGAHTHTYKTSGLGATGLAGDTGSNLMWGWATTGNPVGTAEGAHSHALSMSGTTNSSGVSGTDANMPPYYALYYIFKV